MLAALARDTDGDDDHDHHGDVHSAHDHADADADADVDADDDGDGGERDRKRVKAEGGPPNKGGHFAPARSGQGGTKMKSSNNTSFRGLTVDGGAVGGGALPARVAPIPTFEEVAGSARVGYVRGDIGVDVEDAPSSAAAAAAAAAGAGAETESVGGVEAATFTLCCPIGVISHRDGVHACEPRRGKESVTVFSFLGYDAASDTSLVQVRCRALFIAPIYLGLYLSLSSLYLSLSSPYPSLVQVRRGTRGSGCRDY